MVHNRHRARDRQNRGKWKSKKNPKNLSITSPACMSSLHLLFWKCGNTLGASLWGVVPEVIARRVVRWERVATTASVVWLGGLYFCKVFGIGQADPRKTANMQTSNGLALSSLYTSFVCMSTILAGRREALPRNQQKWSSTTLFNMQLFLDSSLIIICCTIPKGFIGSDEQNRLLYSFQEYIESKVDVIRFFFLTLNLQRFQ